MCKAQSTPTSRRKCNKLSAWRKLMIQNQSKFMQEAKKMGTVRRFQGQGVNCFTKFTSDQLGTGFLRTCYLKNGNF
jgi:hypothetical protein